MPQSSDLQKFCLRWNDYRSSVTAAFEGLRQDEELLDMTLCCEGKKIKAHRVMLSACSPFFRELLKENPCQHPVFMLRDVSYRDLWSAIEFVYKGEVNVRQADLATFLKTAEMLQLRGLTEEDGKGQLPHTPAGSGSTVSNSARSSAGTARRRAWEKSSDTEQPAESSSRPSKRPRPASDTAGPPPPPPPPPLQSSEIKQESSPPPPPPVYGVEESPASYSAEESDPSLQTILYHSVTPEPREVDLDSDDRTAGSTDSFQFLNTPNVAGGLHASAATRGDVRGPYACETCGRVYVTRNALGKHRKVHLGQTTCHSCYKVFSSKWRLQYHFKTTGCVPPGPE
ncbi:broad-complex core protein isoforms 1/2/3/4/5-like isoform X2 [Amphibalanus amphitrite]|uniref:broad-complex core protein isoforms 1/2/3/4/5-like isoform X2 n=1 Tax=Amphibalanus amphitrite TaxID=1232801 RepID=UPI001C905B15|nr:broad-complex core protein isoforms 1/2/3/4/5-like isoform X2 [Amphibalanus amphitrite]XP_043221337.1 broad-complex core protein isoforms 1/2/3/4/5-like isoform X2 [Amphibalanus amphitrite]XP_043221338.1 broad-complex core protein isoforms 1/2/3/4/5-like isoform X2 [Amphibalanus amphitrite]XP_043221340.1 broad-complex core protein isoforms 1/2/3/4/5-like isoform X2 [Amphibalanus amphitrite]XP_043221341.1 broad-complex core protein isoforms 1/2/3/4/5-like isoform X2 [Amphibalanus amphitrite]